jgi:PKD repeat protein
LVRYNSSRVDTISIPGAWFESNDSAGWAVLKINNRNINSITIIGATHKLINSKDFFHFGMTNGTSGQTNKYGYFSSFNPTQADVYSPQTQTNNFIGCYGDTITLLAKGGLGYTWHYGSPDGPPTYLSDFKSAYPSIINCPIGNHLFFTEINHGKCFSVDTLRVSVNINPIPLASFAVDKTTVCSPELVTFKDQSVNADFYFWQKQTLSNTWEDIKLSDTINPRQFTLLVFTDNKLYFQDIAYKLIATSKFGCTDDTSIILTAYPQLVADFSPKDTIGVPPLQISFKDNSQIFGKPSYTWISNDIVFSSKLTATQIFKNLTSDIVTYYLKLIVKNDYCADTAFGTVRVLTLANKIEPIDIQKELNIYPVPAIDNLNINFKNSKPGNIKLEITSLSGKVIYSTIQYLKTSGESTITIPTKKIPDNLFIIRLYKDSKMFICKGMKK